MLTSDTSGIELYITENNPKTLNSLLRNGNFHRIVCLRLRRILFLLLRTGHSVILIPSACCTRLAYISLYIY